MKYILEYEQFSHKEATIDFIDGKMSEKKYLEYLEIDFIKEGIFDSIKDFVNNVKTKIMDVMLTFVSKAYTLGVAIWDKFKVFLTGVFKLISGFKKKHPIIFKIIIICILIIILTIASSIAAHAQSTGKPIDKDHWNRAIGLIDFIRTDQMDALKDMNKNAISQKLSNAELIRHVEQFLTQCRDGKITYNADNIEAAAKKGNEVCKLAKMAIDGMDSSKDMTSDDAKSFNHFVELGRNVIDISMDKFADMVQYTIKTADHIKPEVSAYKL